MKAVFSFWSKPHLHDSLRRWPEEKFHLFSWVLAFENAKNHFDEVILHTDDYGVELLHSRLELPWTEVHRSLNDIESIDCHWWDFGKFYTCGIQKSAFVHIDSDVFLWKHFDKRIFETDIIVQNKIKNSKRMGGFGIPVLEKIEQYGGYIPEELQMIKQCEFISAVNTGIVGGNSFKLFSYFLKNAFKFITDKVNVSLWNVYGHDFFLVGEIYLGMILEHCKLLKNTEFSSLNINYLFKDSAESYETDIGKKKGYTHLIGRTKWDNSLLECLESRVKRDYPDYYLRCINEIQ